LIAVAVLAGLQRQGLALATIEWSDLNNAGSIYFASSVRPPQQATFRATLAAARVRVATLEAYGGPAQSAQLTK
jgi:hypothetical protein